MKKCNAILAGLLIVCLLLGMTACKKSGDKKSEKSLTVEPPKAAADYEEVGAALKAASSEYEFTTSAADFTAENGFKETTIPAAEDGAVADYSGTNVQVEGIDEADILKTDGKYIYAMFGNLLKVYRADGENTAVVCEYILGQASEDTSFYASELYLADGKLFVISECSAWSGDDTTWYCKNSTEIDVYDVTDPAQPKLAETYGQDGNYISSRMTDGMIYLVSSNYVYDETYEGEDWIPRTYCGGKETMIPANQIYICPSASGTCLTQVGAFDCKTLAATDVCSFTGSVDTVYMNGSDIYLATTEYRTTESEPYKKDQYQVVDYQDESVTAINRITVTDGKLELTASGSVDGFLVNQFALDAYDGMLRVATTVSSSSHSVYTDEKYEFSNIIWGDNVMDNTVTVLDSDLNPIGSLGGIAPDERIYSVRYFGEVAYVVTYESIDPVFAIDLSDPENPTTLSALEVLGVSDYLHGYGDGLLFGLGRALDEEGISEGIQLSMFDVTDPKDVRLITKTVLDEWSSDALYNHKAILIDPQKNLICFPGVNSNYFVFSYNVGTFKQEGSFCLIPEDSGSYWSWSTTRGVYVGNYLYILCDEALCVVDMKDYSVVKQITNAEG